MESGENCPEQLPMFLQQLQRELTVALRQRAVTHHVGEHDGRELPYLVVAHLLGSSQSFWKRGSFRSGSNIGSSRSSAGVSGRPEASSPAYGIESTFCIAT